MRVTKQHVCKVVDSYGSQLLTRNNTAWEIGVPQFSRNFKNAVSFDSREIADYQSGKLHPIKNRPTIGPMVLAPCSSNAVHWYIHPVQAMLFSPLHNIFFNPTLFRAKPLGKLGLSASKCWSDGLVLVEKDNYFTTLMKTVTLSQKCEHDLADIISINFVIEALREIRKRVRQHYADDLANITKTILRFFRYAKSCKDFSLRNHPQEAAILSTNQERKVLLTKPKSTAAVILCTPNTEVDDGRTVLKSWYICLLGRTFPLRGGSLHVIATGLESAAGQLQERFGVSNEIIMRMILRVFNKSERDFKEWTK